MGGAVSLGLLATACSLVPQSLRRTMISQEPALAPAAPPPVTVADAAPPANPETETPPEETAIGPVASAAPLAMLYKEDLREFNFGQDRIFQGKRYSAFVDYVHEHLPIDESYRFIEADFATDEDLLSIGDSDYINYNKQYFKGNGADRPIDEQFLKYHLPDNKLYRGAGKVERAARLLIGQAKMAADLVQSGEYTKAVSVGGGMHHAFRKYGGAFSLYNDAAYCAAYLLERHGLERVLVLDTDAHAGNGTSSYFYEDPRVLFIDLHQDPATLYPGTGFAEEIGSGPGKGFTVNVPFPPEADYDCYRLAFEAVVEPVTREFRPQVVIWNGGADPHIADPIAGLGLKTGEFRWLGKKAGELADICGGKAVMLIMSGYTPAILPVAWFGSVIGFGGIEYGEEETPQGRTGITAQILHSRTEEVIKTVRRHLSPYWKSLRGLNV